MKTQISFHRHPLEDNSFRDFKVCFFHKITIASSCEDSSMLVSSINSVERFSDHSLNLIISLGPIPCFHFDTRMLYI